MIEKPSQEPPSEEADSSRRQHHLTRRGFLKASAALAGVASAPVVLHTMGGEKAALTSYSRIPPSEIANSTEKIQSWFLEESERFANLLNTEEVRSAFSSELWLKDPKKSSEVFSRVLHSMPHISSKQALLTDFNPITDHSLSIYADPLSAYPVGNGVELSYDGRNSLIGTARHVASELPNYYDDWSADSDSAVGVVPRNFARLGRGRAKLADKKILPAEAHGKMCVLKGTEPVSLGAVQYVSNALSVTPAFFDWILDHIDYYNSFPFLHGLFGAAMDLFSQEELRDAIKEKIDVGNNIMLLTPHNSARQPWSGKAEMHGLSGSPVYMFNEGKAIDRDPPLFGIFYSGLVLRVDGRSYSVGFAQNAIYDVLETYKRKNR